MRFCDTDLVFMTPGIPRNLRQYYRSRFLKMESKSQRNDRSLLSDLGVHALRNEFAYADGQAEVWKVDDFAGIAWK